MTQLNPRRSFSVADIEMSNRHGHTCLMIACYNGHYRVAKYLLSLRADVNRKSVKGNTALHDCAESGNLVILKLLIANGAKMDVDSYGKFVHLKSAFLFFHRRRPKRNVAIVSCCRWLSLR